MRTVSWLAPTRANAVGGCMLDTMFATPKIEADLPLATLGVHSSLRELGCQGAATLEADGREKSAHKPTRHGSTTFTQLPPFSELTALNTRKGHGPKIVAFSYAQGAVII